MKKILSIILSLVLLITAMPLSIFEFKASAATENTDRYYSYEVVDGNAIITDVNTSISGDVTIPSILNGYIVTSIGSSAFYNCSNLTSVTIPDSVTIIDDCAFDGCTSLTSVTIGDGVTSIGYCAFCNCTSLTSVTIGDGVTSIGDSAFDGCYGLTKVCITDIAAWCNIYFEYFSSNPLYYAGNLYLNGELVTDLTIPDSVTSIGFSAFYNCSNLTSVTIPDSVTNIGSCAFEDCTNLTSVTIGDSVTNIDSYAFNNCSNLTSVYITNIAAWCNINFHNSSSNPLYYAGNLYLNGELVTDLTIPDSVTSIGSSAFYNCSNLTSVTIPDSVTNIGSCAFEDCTNLTSVYITDIAAWCNIDFNVTTSNPLYYAGNLYLNGELVTNLTIPGGVTSINDYAFYNCSNLTSVTIPDSVTSIGNSAFYGCTSLKSVYITDIAAWCNIDFNATTSNPLYYAGNLYLNGELVTNLTIPGGVTSINDYAFYNCSNLTSVTIPDSVTNIGSCAFEDCTSLTNLTIPDSLISIGENAFYNTGYYNYSANWENKVLYIGKYLIKAKTSIYRGYAIKPGTLNISDSAFENCTSLTSVTIPDSVTSIGYSAFSGCTSLTSVTKGDSVTSIGSYAFCNCESLTSVTIGNGVTSIGEEAFLNCTSLTSVTIPNSVTSIGNSAFFGCSGLTKVCITDIAAWCNIDFYNSSSNPLYYAYRLYLNDERVTNLTIPGGVTSINDYTFYKCISLTSVTILDSVTSIGEGAFSGCTSLTSVTIPDSVTSIGDSSFEYCLSLTSVTIGDGVTSIGNYAFYNTTSLTSVYTTDISAWCNIDFYNYRSNPLYYAGNLYLNGELVTDLTIPDGVTSIGNWAFYYCTSLTSVTIPDSVTSIGKYAFYDCTSLKKVCYRGSSEDKAKVSIGAYNSNLTGVTWYYNSCIGNANHTYDNGCDSVCNICDIERTVKPHRLVLYTFENATNYPFSLSDGVYSSTNKADSSSATATITVKEKGSITIRYYISTESSYDKLTIKLNSETKVTASGNTSWNSITIPVVAGDKIYITYNKDSGKSSGSDLIKFELSSDNERLTDNLEPTCEEGVVCYVCDKTVKEALGHTYSSDCDETCSVCGKSRTTTSAHTYDNGCDTGCNICGAVRTITHTYSNECDRDCNICGEFRKAPHKYNNACDDTCNLCGTEREVGDHVYSNDCDKYCNECNAYRTVPNHVYSNACDTTCNVCEAVRSVPAHVYTNRCDEDCDICGYVRTPYDHRYTNTCDTICNECGEKRTITHTHAKECSVICDVCGETREAITDHTYTNTCDTICNECGETRTIQHTYGNSCDIDCNVCGYVRSIEHTYTDACDGECDVCFETRKPPHEYDGECDGECNLCGKTRTATEHNYSWVIDSEENCGFDGKKHEECTVCHAKRNENTVIPATGDHKYDNDCDTDCNICGLTRTTTHNYEWVIDSEENCGFDGKKHEECTVCHAKRNENTVIPATGDHTYETACDGKCNVCEKPRTAPHDYDNACDSDCNLCGKMRKVPDHDYGDDLVCDECGHKEYTPGDIDGNDNVDLSDVVVLAQYAAGWEVTCNEAALDVDGNGTIDLNDVVILAQYVAGWDVVIG